jgi:hypothetical protein
MNPSDALVFLSGELDHQKSKNGLTLESIKDAMRVVVHAEGVNLHRDQKLFFRDLIADLIEAGEKP